MQDQPTGHRGLEFSPDVGISLVQAGIIRRDIDGADDRTARRIAVRAGPRGREDGVNRVAQTAAFPACGLPLQPEQIIDC